MAFIVKDRVKETTTTVGTGTIALDGASAGYQSFSVIGDGNTTYYSIVDVSNEEWEVGLGTYTASGTTLSRDSVLESSNAGSLVDFGAGTKDVFVTYPAEQAVFLNASQTLTHKFITSPTILSGSITSTTINDPTITGAIAEEVYAISGTVLDPANGTIQTVTLSANTTFTESLSDGESMTLMIDDGTAYTITWPTMQWAGGEAPTLATSGYSVVVLWKVGSTLYGTSVGDMA